MDTTNSTTSLIVESSSSEPSTSSTAFGSSTTSSPNSRHTAPGRPSNTLTTSTITFVTVIYSTPTTSFLTTILHINTSLSPADSPSSQSTSPVVPLTRQTIPTVTIEVSDSASSTSSSSGTISSESNNQRPSTLPIFVVIGLVVALIFAGSIFLFRRRRRRRSKKEDEHTFQRPESRPSFVDADPFGCSAESPASVTRSAQDEPEDHRKSHPVFDTTNWWDSVVNGTLVYKPYPRKPRSPDDESRASLYSQRSANALYLATTYPSILFEQEETIGGKEQILNHDAMQRNLGETSISMPTHHIPLSRPPRSPRRKSGRPSLDSLSTSPSSIAPPYRFPSENRIEELPYDGTTLIESPKEVNPAVIF